MSDQQAHDLVHCHTPSLNVSTIGDHNGHVTGDHDGLQINITKPMLL